MVEPLFWFETDQAPEIGATLELSGAEAKHASSVRRMRVGEKIQLGNRFGLRVRGLVTEVSPSTLKIEVEEAHQEQPPNLNTVLIQGLAKGDRDEMAVQACTEIGVSEFIPWAAQRSISRWDGAKIAKGVARWQAIASEAAKQSLRAFEPQVRNLVTTADLVNLISSFDLVMILEPTADKKLGEVKLPEAGSLAIIVGPEGGISEQELAQFEAAGAQQAALGRSVLRTSTAGLAAFSVIHGQIEGWA